MSIMIGIMAIFMAVGIIFGHRHMMGGMTSADTKVEQGLGSSGEGPDKGRNCDDCLVGVGEKGGVGVGGEGSDKYEKGR